MDFSFSLSVSNKVFVELDFSFSLSVSNNVFSDSSPSISSPISSIGPVIISSSISFSSTSGVISVKLGEKSSDMVSTGISSSSSFNPGTG